MLKSICNFPLFNFSNYLSQNETTTIRKDDVFWLLIWEFLPESNWGIHQVHKPMRTPGENSQEQTLCHQFQLLFFLRKNLHHFHLRSLFVCLFLNSNQKDDKELITLLAFKNLRNWQKDTQCLRKIFKGHKYL